MASALFSPISLGAQKLANRIVVSPMCQYSADDGSATPWHRVHLGGLAGSGAGLVMVEATAVERAGRITHGCLGLYSESNEAALRETLAVCRSIGAARFGIQLSHAGRKGSCQPPWAGGASLGPQDDPWRLWSASEVGGLDCVACGRADLERIRQAFADATRRAVRLGFDVIEMHAAHGYLLHQFLSPLSNRRTDAYGGSLDNRMRFPLEVFEAMRAAAPAQVPIGARITGSDWVEGGISIAEATVFARELQGRGSDFVEVTSGGLVPAQIPIAAGYQVPFARAVREAVDMPVWAVGMIVDPRQAEELVATGSADVVALARAFIDNPHWPYEAARVLGADIEYPRQYARARPSVWPGSRLKDVVRGA